MPETPGWQTHGIAAAMAVPTQVAPSDELLLPMHRRTIAQYAKNADGEKELRLFYGDKEISFDEPELFAFGEKLASQSRFQAQSATGWGAGYAWERVQELLTQLVDAGVLMHDNAVPEDAAPDRGGMQPSPLPPATCETARDWSEFEKITHEFTDRPVELGYLELIIPIFRVAHIVVDSEDRQVGEANVFPRGLRLDVPTEWRTCNFPGSRYQSERPMNVTAMRSMRTHWAQMMAGILRVRAGFLRRFPEAEGAWTVGHIERLATAVLAVPTYQVMRQKDRVQNGQLHPALASMFRVTDGVRMTMHQMLFIPIGEPALAPTALVTVDEILDYAERNHSFHSDYGVCAGPRAMVREFLQVLIDGRAATDFSAVVLEQPIRAALDDLEAALDYGLLGLQAYAAVFSLWPAMTRAYEKIASLAAAWGDDAPVAARTLRYRMRLHLDHIKQRSYLAEEQWRIDREQVYADMYAQCGRGLRDVTTGPDLLTLLAPVWTENHMQCRDRLHGILHQHIGDVLQLTELTSCIMDFIVLGQAVLRAACPVQAKINGLLQRMAPQRRLSAADIDVHNLLQGAESRRLPFLIDELAQLFGMTIAFTADELTIGIQDPAA